jgi:hypothetical protein
LSFTSEFGRYVSWRICKSCLTQQVQVQVLQEGTSVEGLCIQQTLTIASRLTAPPLGSLSHTYFRGLTAHPWPLRIAVLCPARTELGPTTSAPQVRPSGAASCMDMKARVRAGS